MVLIFFIFISFGLVGCGYHHNDEDSSESDSGINQGIFLDSPVQGLHYESDTQSGITDENGYFHYKDGEMILFSMGGIFMGEALAGNMMTPIDLVPDAMDETHPTVTNMLRFMQTLDVDNNPENGITFPVHILDELEGRPIHFDMDPAEFEHHVDIEMFMDTIHGMDENYAGRTMVSIEDAQEHMRNTMTNMMNGNVPVEDGASQGGGMSGGSEMMNDGVPSEDGMTGGGML